MLAYRLLAYRLLAYRLLAHRQSNVMSARQVDHFDSDRKSPPSVFEET